MAGIIFPENPEVGVIVTHKGKEFKHTGNNVWISVPQYTGQPQGSGGGGVDPAAVNTIIDGRIAQDLVSKTELASTITGLNLGTMAQSNLFVSPAAPDNSIGEDGDVWMQVAAST